MTAKITITRGGPSHFKDDLDSLAETVRTAAPGIEVDVRVHERSGYGVTWHEVLTIALPMVEGYAAGKVVDAVIGWARARWSTRARSQESTRPTSINFTEEEGEIIRRLTLGKGPDGNVYDVTYVGVTTLFDVKRQEPAGGWVSAGQAEALGPDAPKEAAARAAAQPGRHRVRATDNQLDDWIEVDVSIETDSDEYRGEYPDQVESGEGG